MKLALYEGAGKITLQERPIPQPGPGEVIVKVKCCGICGTDVHAYLHDGLVPPGIALGHEVVGTIATIGEGVAGWTIGERVLVGPPGPCGECYYCRRGQYSICKDGFFRTNGLAPGRDGGMAEYVRVSFPRNMLFRLPDSLPFEDAVLVDTMGVAYQGIRISQLRLGDTAVVVGAGAIGLCAVQLLKMAGARHITVLEPSKAKTALATKFGADAVFDPTEEPRAIITEVVNLCDGLGADVVFECSGNPQGFTTSIGLTKGDGQVIVLGVSGEPAQIVEAQLVVKQTTIKANLIYDEEVVHLCLGALARKTFRTDGLISDFIRLEDVVERGFERLAGSRDLVKIVIRW